MLTLGHTHFALQNAIGLTHLTTYDRMFLIMIFGLNIRWLADKKTSRKTISDYKMEILLKMGRDQFKKLADKGINIPVALL